MTGQQHKALAFQEPFATFIASGAKTVECRSRKINTPIKDLVVCSSKTASVAYPFPGLTYGYAIALVDVVACEPFSKKDLPGALMSVLPDGTNYAWQLENARLIKPFPVKATASFFYVDHDIEIIPNTFESYAEHMWPIAFDGDQADIEDITDLIFNCPDEIMDAFGM